MASRFKAFMLALHNPLPREQVLLSYLLVTMSVAAVYQTAPLTDPIVAVGVPEELAPLCVLVVGALLLSWPFRNLRTLHMKVRGKLLTTDQGYEGMAKLGRLLSISAWVGKFALKLKGVSLILVGVALLIAWLT